MLTENDVVKAVARYLQLRGNSIERALTTNERGIDIVAKNRHTGRKLFVEAKGGTSSKETTKRFGKPFTPNQAKSHVSVALYCAARLHQTAVAEQADVALAFPDDRDHRKLIQNISKALKDLRVAVYFVDQRRKVNLFQDSGAQARAPADGLPAAFGLRG